VAWTDTKRKHKRKEEVETKQTDMKTNRENRKNNGADRKTEQQGVCYKRFARCVGGGCSSSVGAAEKHAQRRHDLSEKRCANEEERLG
jgi:hypothetical protein